MREELEAEYTCPHCGTGYDIGDDAIYRDDIQDECASQCDECGEWYQVRCVSVDVVMEATKAAKPQEDQSAE